MGMEISGAEFAQAQVKDGAHVIIDNVKPDQGLIEFEEPIKFGAVDVSHGSMKNAVVAPKGEGDPVVVDSEFPKDAADEWPAPKQIHCFYFVRFRSYEDPKLKSKYEQTKKDIENKTKARSQLIDMLKAKRSDRAAVIAQLKPLSAEDRQYRMMLDGKRKELEPLQAALGKLRSASYTAREKGVSLCSSEEALNDLIASLHYRMQHESNTLAEEKQLLKEIKQLEGTREKVIANDAMKAKIQDSLGQKEAIQDQVKLIGGDLDGVRKEQQEVRKKIKHLEEELNAIDTEISSLREELEALDQKKDKAYDTRNELIKARGERDLAAKKDIAALEELSHAEMEKFMSLWSSDKAFRDDYEKRILPSLDRRQLSRDGRMRNPDEKPLVLEVLPPPIEPVTAPGKVNTAAQLKVDKKRTKEDVKPLQEPNTVSNSTAQNEGHDESTEVQMKVKGDAPADAESFSLPEKTQKESVAANGTDPIKLKEIKREEEMAKAKLASERKKKLAEKAAEKATKRAQKEAERKLKEREKRAKKKAGASIAASDAEQVEAETNDADPEKTEVIMEPRVPAKIKKQKENVRHRKPKGQVPLPKVNLGKKKSQSYWVWAVPATVIALMLAIFAYYYVL